MLALQRVAPLQRVLLLAPQRELQRVSLGLGLELCLLRRLALLLRALCRLLRQLLLVLRVARRRCPLTLSDRQGTRPMWVELPGKSIRLAVEAVKGSRGRNSRWSLKHELVWVR